MAKFILAEKKEMTQKFAPDGTVIPVTKVMAGPCVVTQLKNNKKEGYSAVQIGFGSKKHLSKPLKGHLKKLDNLRYLKEFKITEDENDKLKIGDKITAKVFVTGDIVKVTGVSKGKGFQGVVRRHGFHGSPATHGHKDQNRMPGSIGATGPAHVFKGTKMGGRMGGGQVTVTNLEIVEVDPEKNEIFIRGAVPGPRNNLLLISGVGDLVIEEEKQETSDKKQVTSVEEVDKSDKEKVVEEKKQEKSEEKSKVEDKKEEEAKVEEKPEESKVEDKKEDKVESKKEEEPRVETKEEVKAEKPNKAEEKPVEKEDEKETKADDKSNKEGYEPFVTA